ncbi:hypothetical protein F7725_014110 [Dissostichus mawsoni]|uniref:Uncharacterized protein n=1 Tax=Dissostichus mawsoni TaxID=36200 RepID=A0A7J5YV10_DISMA|nr:hypothetical protein F7725_014110 [Dissostichus mawsoni]
MCPDMGLYNVTFAEVSYSPHEAQLSIPHGNESIVTKQQCLCSLLRPGHLGHDCANHEAVNDAAHYRLEDHHEDSHRALFSDTAIAIPYGKPGENKHKSEDNQHPSPANIDTCGEDVGHVALRLIFHIGKLHIALAILFDKTVAALAPCVDLAIAKAVHAMHGREAEALFLGRHNAVAVYPSNTHAIGNTSRCRVRAERRPLADCLLAELHLSKSSWVGSNPCRERQKSKTM